MQKKNKKIIDKDEIFEDEWRKYHSDMVNSFKKRHQSIFRVFITPEWHIKKSSSHQFKKVIAELFFHIGYNTAQKEFIEHIETATSK